MTLDSAQREAKRIIGNAVARSYGYRRVNDRREDDCQHCEGDGCERCLWTGIKP